MKFFPPTSLTNIQPPPKVSPLPSLSSSPKVSPLPSLASAPLLVTLTTPTSTALTSPMFKFSPLLVTLPTTMHATMPLFVTRARTRPCPQPTGSAATPTGDDA